MRLHYAVIRFLKMLYNLFAMNLLNILKRKTFWVIAVVVVGGGIYWYRSATAPKGPFYDTQPVVQGPLTQTVEATGEVVPQARIDLSFKQGGMITALPVAIGARVKKGDILAQVDATDAQLSLQRAGASVSLALANLHAREAGDTPETIRIAQASVDQAKANAQKAQNDLVAIQQQVQDDYNVAVIAADTAQHNLDNALASNDQTVVNGYVTLKNSLQNALGPTQTGLTDGDAVIGVDNKSESWRYELTLGAGDAISLQNAKSEFPLAKTARDTAFQSVRALTSLSSNAAITSAANDVKDALQKTQIYLDFVQRTLTATPASASFSAADLSSKKAVIDADRASVGAQLTAVTSATQAATNGELARTTTLDQLRNAVQTAQSNLRTADTNRTTKVSAAQSAVQIQAAVLASAQASLDQHKAPPRAVDLNALRAQVSDAQVGYTQAQQRLDDTRIIAPADGIIAELDPKVGEQMMAGAKVIGMIADDKLTIEALIPEADIAKVAENQPAHIVLDAFGESQPFTGTVLAEYPDQTKVQDAVYYKSVIGLDTQGKDVKPGMTADVIIQTAQRPTSTLSIPSRAVQQVNGAPSVQVLVNGVPQNRAVSLGLRADQAMVEVLSGVSVGESVIVGELTADEYKLRQSQTTTTAATK